MGSEGFIWKIVNQAEISREGEVVKLPSDIFARAVFCAILPRAIGEGATRDHAEK
jgi:hypothetical protein